VTAASSPNTGAVSYCGRAALALAVEAHGNGAISTAIVITPSSFARKNTAVKRAVPVARWNWPASPANVNVPVANVKPLLFGEPSVPSYTTPTYGTESKWESLPAPVGIPGSTQAAGEFQRRQGYALSYKKGEANPSWP